MSTIESPPPVPRIAVVGAFVAIAAGLVSMASFEFMLVPMQTELGLSVDTAHATILIASAGALIVVFLAGSLGDRLGYRTLLFAAAALFVIGAVLVSLAQGAAMVVLGRVTNGVGGTVLGIVGLAVLNASFQSDRQRARLFGVFAALTPAMFIVTPVIAAQVATTFGWRAVPLLWVLMGLLTAVVTVRSLPPSTEARRDGELITPLLAGFVLASLALTAATSVESITTALVILMFGAACSVALVVAMRRASEPGLDLRVMRAPGAGLLAAAVLIASAPNLFIYTNLLLQYAFVMPLSQIALLLGISQLAAVGGGLLGGSLSGRFGAPRTAVGVLAVGGVCALGTLAFTATSPVWVPVLILSVVAVPAAAMAGALAKCLMDLAPADGSAGASSWNNALWSLGPTIGGVVVSGLLFTVFERSLSAGLVAGGIEQQAASAVAAQIRGGVVINEMLESSAFGWNGVATFVSGEAPALRAAQEAAYSAAGLLTCALYLVAAALMLGYTRMRARHAAAASIVEAGFEAGADAG